jgi:hypothetical protein
MTLSERIALVQSTEPTDVYGGIKTAIDLVIPQVSSIVYTLNTAKMLIELIYRDLEILANDADIAVAIASMTVGVVEEDVDLDGITPVLTNVNIVYTGGYITGTYTPTDPTLPIDLSLSMNNSGAYVYSLDHNAYFIRKGECEDYVAELDTTKTNTLNELSALSQDYTDRFETYWAGNSYKNKLTMLNSATNLKASVDLKDGIQTTEQNTFMYKGIASWDTLYIEGEIAFWEAITVITVGGDIWKVDQVDTTEITGIYDDALAASLAFNDLCVIETTAFNDAASYISSYAYASQVGGMTGTAALAVDMITPGVR